jgi:hypothetical protein
MARPKSKPKPVKMEKERLRELVGDDFDPDDLDRLYSDPTIAGYLGGPTITESSDREYLR